MTTDRTQPARAAAPTDRPATPAQRSRDGSAFAALLDAHSDTTPRGDAPVRRDDHAPRRDHALVRRDDAAPRRDHPPVRRDDAAPRRDEKPSGQTVPGDGPDRAVRAAAPSAADALHTAPEAPITGEAPTVPTIQPIAAVTPIVSAAPEPVAPEVPAQVAAVVVSTTPATKAPAPVAADAPALPGTQVKAQAPAAAAAVPVDAQAAPSSTETPQRVAAAEAPAPVAEDAPAPAATPAPRAAAAAPAPQAPAQHTQAARHAAPTAQAPIAAAVGERVVSSSQAPTADTGQPATAPATPASATPVAPAVPAPTPLAGTVAPTRTVPLHRAPAAVATLLHVAADRGITHAKMALRPAELGGIEIRLQSTSAGVAAQVVADSPEAARMLAQHGEELRRALEARDVTLLSLEVSTSADQQQQSARGEWTDGDSAGRPTTASGATTGDAEGDDEPAPTTHTIELPGGLLVDVLA